MTYSVTRTVYYGPDRTMYRRRILSGVSFDEAWECVAHRRDKDLCLLNVMYGDGAFTDMLLWPARKHCAHITRIAPSLKYCGSFSELQPREIIYEIWEEAEPYKNYKEENAMTNAELNKKLEDLAEKVDSLGIVAQETTRQLHEIHNTSEAQTDRLNRYRDVQDGQFANYDANIGHLNERLDGCDEYQGLLNDKLEGIEKRLDSMSDAGAYARQVAEESKKIEDALKVTTRKLDLFSQKNMELMERNKRLSEQNVKLQEDVKASNKMCDSVSKKASKLADRVQKLEADSSRTLRLEDLVWQHEDKLAKASKLEDRIQQLETALMQLRLNISSISSVYGIPEESKTIESIYPCLWACVHRGKECNGLAQECPLAEHFSKEHGGGSWKNGVWTDPDGNMWAFGNTKSAEEEIRATEKIGRTMVFDKFNAGKMAIVFDGKDPRFEATYMDFCRAYDEWCHTSEKDDKLYPRSTWKVRGFRMDPLMKCPSIYKDHASFAIWTEWVEEKDEPAFEYGTLQSTWREHKTVGRLPYTVWKI